MHEGAIRYFKEKGLWTAEYQKHNDEWVKRQDTLAAAWAAYKAKASSDEKEFKQGWMKGRAAALTEAGMEPVLTAW